MSHVYFSSFITYKFQDKKSVFIYEVVVSFYSSLLLALLIRNHIDVRRQKGVCAGMIKKEIKELKLPLCIEWLLLSCIYTLHI